MWIRVYWQNHWKQKINTHKLLHIKTYLEPFYQVFHDCYSHRLYVISALLYIWNTLFVLCSPQIKFVCMHFVTACPYVKLNWIKTSQSIKSRETKINDIILKNLLFSFIYRQELHGYNSEVSAVSVSGAAYRVRMQSFFISSDFFYS